MQSGGICALYCAYYHTGGRGPQECNLPNRRVHLQSGQGDHGDSRLELTPRELEVVELVAEGLSNREVAQRLCRSPRTIENHLRSVYQKLNVRNRVEMIRAATDLDLLDVPGTDAPALPASELELKGHTLDLVRALDGRVARAGQNQFFSELAKALTTVLGVRWAGMTEPSPQSDLLTAFCVAERAELQDQAECVASVSPCGATLREREVVVADDVLARFPDWDLGRALGVKAYVGVRVDDPLGRPIGTLWVMDSEPIDRIDEILLILRLFRGRTSAELAIAQLTDQLDASGLGGGDNDPPSRN